MAWIITLIIIIAAIIYSSLSWGLVFYQFWAWFVLPVFTSLPEITFVQAIGLYFFLALFKSQGEGIDSKYKDDNYWAVILILPWIMLIVGWFVYKLFI